MPDNIFYKFKNINEYCIDSLEKKYFYFSIPKILNDPEDCQIPLSTEASDKKMLEWIKHAKKVFKLQNKKYPYDTVAKLKKAMNNHELDEAFSNSIDKAVNHFHLLSLTDSYTYTYMWDHEDYCNNFSGICIGYNSFQLQKPNFSTNFIECNEMTSDYSPYILNIDGKFYFTLKKIEYNNDRLHCYNPFEEKYKKNYLLDVDTESINSQNIKYNFFHKTSQWQNEHEYRGYYYNTNPSNSKIYYPDTTLESITFGKNVSDENKTKIMNIIEHNYTNFQQIAFYIADEQNGNIIRTKI